MLLLRFTGGAKSGDAARYGNEEEGSYLEKNSGHSALVARLAGMMLCLSTAANAAQIPPAFITSVVALGERRPDPTQTDANHTKWMTEGTGFFYGYLVQDDPDALKRQFASYLVTARHVVDEHAANSKADLNVRLDAKDAHKGVQEFAIPTNPGPGDSKWCFHPDNTIDVAVLRVDLRGLRDTGFDTDFFESNRTAANSTKLKELGVLAGDGVFVLGFPMNLAGEQRNYVVVRQGAIARISEMLDGASRTFMADVLVFPGNSGGPVVLKPDITSIEGTKNQPAAYLIGVVLGYLPYQDLAISVQTKRPRVSFEENSGLAEVLPVDYIDQTIEACHASGPPKAPQKHG